MKVANDWSNHGLSKSLPQIQLYLLNKYKYNTNEKLSQQRDKSGDDEGCQWLVQSWFEQKSTSNTIIFI